MSVLPPFISKNVQAPGLAAVPSAFTNSTDGRDASGSVNVATVYMPRYVVSSSASASVTRSAPPV